MAEELPHPRKDLPKAIAAQLSIGCISTQSMRPCPCSNTDLASFCYGIALMYAITDLDAVVNSPGAFPLAVVYAQATGSPGGTVGLLVIIFLSITCCATGITISVSRNLWALARDDAVPFSRWLGYVNEDLGCPVWATVANGAPGVMIRTG